MTVTSVLTLSSAVKMNKLVSPACVDIATSFVPLISLTSVVTRTSVVNVTSVVTLFSVVTVRGGATLSSLVTPTGFFTLTLFCR